MLPIFEVYFFLYLSLVFFGIKLVHIPQPLRSSVGALPEPLGSVDVQDANNKTAHDKLVRNKAGKSLQLSQPQCNLLFSLCQSF